MMGICAGGLSLLVLGTQWACQSNLMICAVVKNLSP